MIYLKIKNMLELLIAQATKEIFYKLYSVDLNDDMFIPSKTRPDFEGDFTIVVFPFVSHSKISPFDLAHIIGAELVKKIDFIIDYNVVKGFLNLKIDIMYWYNYNVNFVEGDLRPQVTPDSTKIMIEFSSPNTNKPLHLGHIRNNLLGVSISNILDFVNNDVTRVSLLNDRGIHICKTILAWERWGDGITPEKANKKGDHLIGDFYVKFEKEYQNEISELKKTGLSEKEAIANSSLLASAKKILRKWERGNRKVLETWRLLNSWVIAGFNDTYIKLGVEFDRVYYESETYLKGKDIVMKELSKGSVKINDDNSVSIDLSEQNLGEKILLRADSTTVYITQDIGTAVDRYAEYEFDKHIYVVGNEQIYHFQVLKEILKKFGFEWSKYLEHFSYGMVELPEGKMKSREGKVVDADDLIEEMIETATIKAKELGKLDELSNQEFDDTVNKIAMGALKYFILKVDPRKNMMFNPKESIDFNGNTGPFIQYSYTRINSLLSKAEDKDFEIILEDTSGIELDIKEVELIKKIYNFKNVAIEAAENLNPALIANYTYDLSKLFNSFYQEIPILKAEVLHEKAFRLKLSKNVAITIKTGLALLGIEVPDRM